jgi:hypothetical protein
LAFLPVGRAGSLEEFGARADHVFVNDKATFLGADEHGDGVIVIVASQALVRDIASGLKQSTDRGRFVGSWAASFSFLSSRERFAGDWPPAMASAGFVLLV